MKEPRPEITKCFISRVGSFNKDREPVDWIMNGSNHPNSVGYYQSRDWKLWGGYTYQELKEIKEGSLGLNNER